MRCGLDQRTYVTEVAQMAWEALREIDKWLKEGRRGATPMGKEVQMSGATQGKVEQHLGVGVVGWRDVLKIPHVFVGGLRPHLVVPRS